MGGPGKRQRLKRRLFREQKVRGKVKCFYCKRSLSFGETTLEHLTPLSENGQFSGDNVVLACLKCNQNRGIKDWKKYKEGRYRQARQEKQIKKFLKESRWPIA